MSEEKKEIREKILTVLDWWKHKHYYAFTGWDSVSSRMTYNELAALDLSIATYENITEILYNQSDIENWRIYAHNVKIPKVYEVDFYTLCNTIPRMFH